MMGYVQCYVCLVHRTYQAYGCKSLAILLYKETKETGESQQEYVAENSFEFLHVFQLLRAQFLKLCPFRGEEGADIRNLSVRVPGIR